MALALVSASRVAKASVSGLGFLTCGFVPMSACILTYIDKPNWNSSYRVIVTINYLSVICVNSSAILQGLHFPPKKRSTQFR